MADEEERMVADSASNHAIECFAARSGSGMAWPLLLPKSARVHFDGLAA